MNHILQTCCFKDSLFEQPPYDPQIKRPRWLSLMPPIRISMTADCSIASPPLREVVPSGRTVSTIPSPFGS